MTVDRCFRSSRAPLIAPSPSRYAASSPMVTAGPLTVKTIAPEMSDFHCEGVVSVTSRVKSRSNLPRGSSTPKLARVFCRETSVRTTSVAPRKRRTLSLSEPLARHFARRYCGKNFMHAARCLLSVKHQLLRVKPVIFPKYQVSFAPTAATLFRPRSVFVSRC
jgi:hypothetical protein